jgi:hypothetical protein
MLIAQSGDIVSDPANERLVRWAVIGLVVVGVVLLVITAWFWHSTRPEPPALASLEEMGRRTYRRLPDDEARQARLDAVRSGAGPQPPEPDDDAVIDTGNDETTSIDPLLRP